MTQKITSASANTDKVYRTLVQPKPETIERLRGWVPPKTAYILFEMPSNELRSDGSSKLATCLYTLGVESRAGMQHHIDHAINKGGRVLDYGNFPKLGDKNPARAMKALHHSEGAGMNPWDALERHIQSKMKAEIGWDDERNSLEQEINVLRQKLAQEEKKRAIKAEAQPVALASKE